MLVKTVMLKSEDLMFVNLEASLREAMEIMDKNNFLSIPVVQDDEFKGSISKNQIYEKYFKDEINKVELLDNIKVKDLLREDMPIINESEEIEKAVVFLEKMSISFVAVVDEFNKFKGILTHKAVFSEFNNAFGLNKGDRIGVRSHDVPGQISKISKIISENNGNVVSFVVLDTKSITQVKEVVIRIKDGNIEEIKRKLKQAGFKLI